MTVPYITRSLEPVLKKAVSEFPAVAITGPRQSGKTTTLTRLFRDSHAYVSLDPPDVRAAALEDPRGFLEMFPPPVIFDEIQHAPELLPYLKERIDRRRGWTGQYVLTGSQNLLLMKEVAETLAGRAAILRLLPLSRREIVGRPDEAFPWEGTKERYDDEARFSYADLWAGLLRGNYPEPVTHPERDANLWHSSFIQTYLERDVRDIRRVGDLSQFRNFLRVLAARSAQLLSLSDIARDLGIAVNTVKAWLSALEVTHQVTVLRPYYANVGKRLVKSPKVYFNDVGTLCHLAGLRDPTHAAAGPMGGPILETAVLSEIVKTLTHRGMDPCVYFWRTSTGTEVDIIVEAEGRLVPIEVKLSATPRPAMASGLKSFRKDFGDRAQPGFLVHPGDIRLPLGEGVIAMPFAGV